MIRPFMTPDDVRRITDFSIQEGYYKVLDTFWLRLREDDYSLGRNIMRDRYWEAWITSWMTKCVTTDMHCLDLGANYGYYTGVLASLGKSVRGVEPNIDIIGLVNPPNASFSSYAIGAEAGDLDLVINSKYPGSSSLAVGDGYFDEWGGETKKVSVPVITLDELTEKTGMPDFIKIDVEGFEPEVFAGGQKTLAANPLITIEITSDHPKGFVDMLFEEYDVWNINFDGNEDKIGRHQIATQAWWMLVLRRKQ